MARGVVAPSAWIIRTIGSTLAANASASARCKAATLASYALEPLGAVEINTVSPGRPDSAEVLP